ncbi:hypothetical protein LCGC14_1147810 [marine sediment metagenome]|uniref:Uncharacterized protein n=1 Tax=marine sediment metagenome TaxID=412755 RepID=A0A0F9LWE8_9ZZZZ
MTDLQALIVFGVFFTFVLLAIIGVTVAMSRD